MNGLEALLPIVLIGPMGSGKSKIGRRLAKTLQVPFVDTDSRIVSANGPITGIFEQHGEAHFRALERAAVATALREPAVVSLGGGAILDEATQHDLAGRTVVFLTITTEAVEERLGGGKRPLLSDGTHVWQRIFDERLPIYESLARFTVDTSTGPITGIADSIAAWVRGQANARATSGERGADASTPVRADQSERAEQRNE